MVEQATVRVAGVIGITAALALGGVAVGLAVSDTTPASASTSATCGGSEPKLTVQGSGTTSATPDLLTVSVDIDVTDPNARASLVDDNTKASAVTAVLRQGGVAAKDIETSNVSIQPNYLLTGAISGYEMTNTITAKVRNFSTAGSVLDSLTAAAGNAAHIDSLSFSIDDPSKIEDKARTDAVHQAVTHARSMAQAAGERLGPVCSLTDDSTPDYGLRAPFASPSAAATNQSAALPLEPGSQEVSAQITLVYALVQPRVRA